jgi:hypothetical protein
MNAELLELGVSFRDAGLLVRRANPTRNVRTPQPSLMLTLLDPLAESRPRRRWRCPFLLGPNIATIFKQATRHTKAGGAKVSCASARQTIQEHRTKKLGRIEDVVERLEKLPTESFLRVERWWRPVLFGISRTSLSGLRLGMGWRALGVYRRRCSGR